MTTRPHIRWMIRRDMHDVLAIDAASFPEPWDEEYFLRQLRCRDVIGMVAEGPSPTGAHDGPVLGSMVYRLHRERLELLRLAVHADHRNRGVGRAMLDKLIGKITSHRRTTIDLQVGESNLPAQLWLRACGFRATTVLRDAYEGSATTEDAYRFEYRFAPEPEPIERPPLVMRFDRDRDEDRSC